MAGKATRMDGVREGIQAGDRLWPPEFAECIVEKLQADLKQYKLEQEQYKLEQEQSGTEECEFPIWTVDINVYNDPGVVIDDRGEVISIWMGGPVDVALPSLRLGATLCQIDDEVLTSDSACDELQRRMLRKQVAGYQNRLSKQVEGYWKNRSTEDLLSGRRDPVELMKLTFRSDRKPPLCTTCSSPREDDTEAVSPKRCRDDMDALVSKKTGGFGIYRSILMGDPTEPVRADIFPNTTNTESVLGRVWEMNKTFERCIGNYENRDLSWKEDDTWVKVWEAYEGTKEWLDQYAMCGNYTRTQFPTGVSDFSKATAVTVLQLEDTYRSGGPLRECQIGSDPVAEGRAVVAADIRRAR